MNDSIRIRQRQSSYLRIKETIYICQYTKCQIFVGKDLGQHVANIVSLDRDETIIWATVVPNFEEEKRFIVFVTRNGMIKKTELNQYKVQRYSRAFVAVNLKKMMKLSIYLRQMERVILFLLHTVHMHLFSMKMK